MSPTPLATYRLQLHPGFTFAEAAALVDYLAALGVSHLFASPCLQAAAGSTHGYDVVDPGRASEPLGGAAGHEALCKALTKVGLGQILDIVPNHMAVTRENQWWWDVLESGPASRYAGYFDVDWDPPESRLGNRILLPVLGDHYGRVLEAGSIRLERRDGDFLVRHFDHAFPVDPRSTAGLLARAAQRAASEDLAFAADALDYLPPPTAVDPQSLDRLHRDKSIIRKQVRRLLAEQPGAAAAIDAEVAALNANPDALHELLERQNYRLAYWRSAQRDLGYRRFFDINTLVALRAENEAVFADTHRLILAWLAEGVLDGVRVDHPDGLRDPEQYCRRLRAAAPDAWIVVEKILHPGEWLRPSWPVHGTTGYDFLNAVNQLYVDSRGEAALTQAYVDFTGQSARFEEVLHARKCQVVRDLFGSDLNRLTVIWLNICENVRQYRDFTRHELHEALQEIVACFPVYRTYIRANVGAIEDEDRQVINETIEQARANLSALDPDLFEFLRDILLLKRRGALETELVMRLQQLTGPVMAKGMEDTAFYNYNRLLSLNEVGGDPAQFGWSVERFHDYLAESFRRHPTTMLTSSTHDTKRSEGVRARISLLSEVPALWIEAVGRWTQHNARYRRNDAPDSNTEYQLYQTLVGAWPISLDRMLAYAKKSVREAKTFTSWNHPDAAYEEGVRDFVRGILTDDSFRADLEAFVAPLISPGRVHALAQTLLKLTAPGVPDLYQGTELWHLRLVDPDNRHPVDFERRRALLAALDDATPETVLQRMDEGMPKLWVTRQALALRRRQPELFGPAGGYTPIPAHGEQAQHVVAFSRGGAAVTVVPRLVLSLGGQWNGTMIPLPAGRWQNVLTGEQFQAGPLPVEQLLQRFPVALLERDPSEE